MKTRTWLQRAGAFCCLLFIALFFSSCGNCRWVEDCRCEDGGYWDCSSTESPLESTSLMPDVEVTINGSRQSEHNCTTTYHYIHIRNKGNGTARNLGYHLSIKRPKLGSSSGIETLVNEDKEGLSLPANDSLVISKSVSEPILIHGDVGLYWVSIIVSYRDAQGSWHSISDYLDY